MPEQREQPTAAWRVSSYCDNSYCVAIAPIGDRHVGLRNSNAPDAGAVFVTREGMGDFLRGIAAGEFDDLA